MNVKTKMFVLETVSVSTPMVHTHVYVMKGISMYTYQLRISTSVKVRNIYADIQLHKSLLLNFVYNKIYIAMPETLGCIAKDSAQKT